VSNGHVIVWVTLLLLTHKFTIKFAHRTADIKYKLEIWGRDQREATWRCKFDWRDS